MNLRSRLILGCGPAVAAVLLAQSAEAQTTTTTTTTTTGAVIGPGEQMYPERFIAGADIGQSTRPRKI